MTEYRNAMDDSEVIDILRESPSGLNASAIAKKTTFASNGSDRRLDRAFQRLRRAGRINFGGDRTWWWVR